MSVEFRNNTFVSYLIILFALFILVLFTKDQIMKTQYNLDKKEQATIELQDIRDKQQALDNIATEVEQQGSETERYLTPFTEDEIVDYFYSYADSMNTGSGKLLIKSINVSKETKNELGFFETTVNINAQVSDKQMMKTFLDYLVAEDAKYRFFIDSFMYPNDDREGNFNIQVPLKIFYR